VIGITERQRQRVSKYRRCFLESDTVLPTVRRCLDGVPLELHASILGRQDEPGKARGNEAGALFGADAQSWINLQTHYDLQTAREGLAATLAGIRPHVADDDAPSP
jgi:hypothetical protein